jgi:hypothetical protein
MSCPSVLQLSADLGIVGAELNAALVARKWMRLAKRPHGEKCGWAAVTRCAQCHKAHCRGGRRCRPVVDAEIADEDEAPLVLKRLRRFSDRAPAVAKPLTAAIDPYLAELEEAFLDVLLDDGNLDVDHEPEVANAVEGSLCLRACVFVSMCVCLCVCVCVCVCVRLCV